MKFEQLLTWGPSPHCAIYFPSFYFLFLTVSLVPSVPVPSVLFTFHPFTFCSLQCPFTFCSLFSASLSGHDYGRFVHYISVLRGLFLDLTTHTVIESTVFRSSHGQHREIPREAASHLPKAGNWPRQCTSIPFSSRRE